MGHGRRKEGVVSMFGGILETLLWCWLVQKQGKKPTKVQLIERDTVIVWLLLEEEVEEVLWCADDQRSYPFVSLDRRMEVIGSPPCPRWIKFFGVPLQVWKEGISRLLGDCLGCTLEVDRVTILKEVLTHGRVKVKLGKVCKLPFFILFYFF